MAEAKGRRLRKEKGSKGDTGEVRLTAATADRHILYEAAVQSVDFEIELFERIFRRKRGRTPRTLREDFCGTAALACAWTARGPDRSAIAFDLHRPTLRWGARRHLARLGAAADRVALVCADVRSIQEPRVDVVVALNYSYSVFKDRGTLLGYFRSALASLCDDGIFVVDAFGGTQATEELEEKRKVDAFVAPDGRRFPSFTYFWDQVRFNPVNHEILCRIHFGFKDGTRMKNAFTYRWRYWTLPELQELMRDAGFREVEVYAEGWDEDADEPDGRFRARRMIPEMAGWVGYVVGLR